MYNIVILHGSYGSPFENWIPWLGKELTDKGYKVLCPQFPTPNGQNYKVWFDVLNQYKDYFDRNNTIFVTHSVSCSFAVKYLIQTQKHIKAFISVAGFTELKRNQETQRYHDVIKSFVEDISFEHFDKYAKKRIQIYSNNDGKIEQAELEKFADLISAEKRLIKDGGHFNIDSGAETFEYLLEEIERVLPLNAE